MVVKPVLARLFWLLHLLISTQATEVDPFADSIPFAIKWNGPLDSTDNQLSEDSVVLPMITKDKEKYQCHFENIQGSADGKSKSKSYSGPSAQELLDDFAVTTACSYRVENYWTYELCHGKHLRQYHEERDPKSDDGKNIVYPEYYLGMYQNNQPDDSGDDIPSLILENVKYPYLAVTYNEGTTCDLTQTPRRTTVQYICYDKGRGDLYQIKETSTCEYTALVLVSQLCHHPAYQPIRETSRVITCHSLEGAPEKPKMVYEMDQTLSHRSQLKSGASSTASGDTSTTKEKQESTRTGIGKTEDDIFLVNFLSGEYCLQGGGGWWNYELCYGRTAKQFHVEGGKRVTNILLGKWDLKTHLDWLEENPSKNMKKRPNRRYISQFYSSGDFCEETKTPRSVEVKLKCSKTGGSSHAVAIYLLEPVTCQYTLTVESPILCDLVDRADDRGLIL